MQPLGLVSNRDGELGVGLRAGFPSVQLREQPGGASGSREQGAQEEARLAVAEAAAAAQRRMYGHVPGDRVGSAQMEADLKRDRVVVDGRMFTNSGIAGVVRGLAEAVFGRVIEMAKGDIFGALWVAKGGPRADSGASSGGFEPTGVTSAATQQGLAGARRAFSRLSTRAARARLSAAVAAFARDTLACCSRSVLDGDPLVVVTQALGNPELVHLRHLQKHVSPLFLSTAGGVV